MSGINLLTRFHLGEIAYPLLCLIPLFMFLFAFSLHIYPTPVQTCTLNHPAPSESESMTASSASGASFGLVSRTWDSYNTH